MATRALRVARPSIGFAAALCSASLASSCVVPPPPPPPPLGRDVVVFDIDGTLTTDEGSNAVQPDAANAVKAYVEKGYSVVYVTARWKSVQESSTRSWLADNGFPDLPLYMSPTLLIDDQSKIDYKTDTLADIESGDPEVAYAYGDSSSDFAAYANAGVAKAHVFALKRSSASTCQSGTYQACLVGYTAHLTFIDALPAGQ